MSSNPTELSDVQQALTQLRSAVTRLRSKYGDEAGMRRVSNDVERLEIDVNELTGTAPEPRGATRVHSGETVIVPDTPYDPALFHGVDDEGVGGRQDRQ